MEYHVIVRFNQNRKEEIMRNEETDRYEILISFKILYNDSIRYENGLRFTSNSKQDAIKDIKELIDSSVEKVYIYDRVSKRKPEEFYHYAL